ncbi:protein kinase [Balamuthia mandrillaris]
MVDIITGFCITGAFVFGCIGVMQALRVAYVFLRGRRVFQLATYLLLFFVITSAVSRAIFFGVFPLGINEKFYFLLWWVPLFMNISATIILIRLWMITYANTRHVAEQFLFSGVRKSISRFQYTLVAVMLVAQLAIWAAMFGLPFDKVVRADAGYVVFCEVFTVTLGVAALFAVQKIFRRAKKRNPVMLRVEPFPANLSRADVVMISWIFGRLLRLGDSIGWLVMDDIRTVPGDAYWVYVGPLYFFTELLPSSLLIFGPAVGKWKLQALLTFAGMVFNYLLWITPTDMLDHGMVNYRKMKKALEKSSALPTYTNSYTNSISSNGVPPSINLGDEEMDETTALLSSVSVEPTVRNWIIDYNELRMLEFLGGGAGGEVWKAVYKDSVVAVKKLRSMLIDSPQDLADFCKEMRIISSLRHENVVSFYGACVVPPNISIVSEYLPRKSLRTVIDDDRLDLSLSVRMGMMIEMCKALRFVHANNIIHRDLKPENLMIGSHFNLKVGDFGSGTISPFAADTKKSGFLLSIAGSTMYMAPEVYQRKYTFSADVFSAGIILWEVFTMTHIWNCGVSRDELLDDQLRPSIPEDCPPVLAKIIARAWDHNPKARPNFAEILRVLLAWQEVDFRHDFEAELHCDEGPSSTTTKASLEMEEP